MEEKLLSKRNAFVAVCDENTEYDQRVEDYRLNIYERYSIKTGEEHSTSPTGYHLYKDAHSIGGYLPL